MQNLELSVTQQMGVITGNFDAIKAQLESEMEEYKGKTFTEETKKKAKEDLADLRKLKKNVNARKMEVKKAYMKPYDDFEEKVKELICVIDEPIGLIDGQVKEFEEKRINERKAAIEDLYDETVEEELRDYIPLERIYGDKWTNATTTMKSIREEINLKVMQTRQDITTIKAMKSEKEEEALHLYMNNNNLAHSIQFLTRYEQEKAEILKKREKEEQERRERELEAERERVREEERKRIREEERLKEEAAKEAIADLKAVDEEKAADLSSSDSKRVIYTVVATDAELEEIEMALTSLGVYFERKDV